MIDGTDEATFRNNRLTGLGGAEGGTAVRRGVGQNLLKRLDHSFDMPILAEVRFATAAGISSELPLVLGVVQQRTNAQGQVIGVVRIDFDSAFPVDDRFPETALIRIDNRQATPSSSLC